MAEEWMAFPSSKRWLWSKDSRVKDADSGMIYIPDSFDYSVTYEKDDLLGAGTKIVFRSEIAIVVPNDDL